LSWDAASDLATSGGGHLAVMSNEKEAAYTRGLLQQVLVENKSCWIGARKSTQDPEVWENVTKESFDFLTWLPGQPDNFGDGEEFLVIRKVGGQVGANDESGRQEPVNYLLIEWSHPSQRNFSSAPTTTAKEPNAQENAFAEVRGEIIEKHGKDYLRFRKKYDDIIDDFIKKSTSEVVNLEDRLTPEQQAFLIARLKALEGAYWLPDEIPARSPKKIKRYFEDAQADAQDLWDSYEEDFNEALRDYFELLNEASRRAFKQGDQVLGQAFKLETASLNDDSILLHKILNGEKVPLPTEKKEDDEEPKKDE
ncbi:C-type lectin domain-containing protein, partial [Akkermansiaceae bacterium]|nr:C-type lectin domain-containing protein [Akkermansiaceae bacterium]